MEEQPYISTDAKQQHDDQHQLRASLFPSSLRNYDYRSQAAWLRSYIQLPPQLGRRWSRVLLSTLSAIVLVLFFQDRFHGDPTSTQTANLVSRRTILNVVRNPKDAFRNYVKEGNCSFSNLDLHQPFRPLCKDRTSLLEAMSSGGRLGFEQPYMPLGCDMRWFDTAEICDILARFDNIFLAGDSQTRYLTQAFNVLLREDLVNGSLATWRFDLEDNPGCDCHHRFYSHKCTWWIALSTNQVLDGDPKSIRCPKHKRPASVEYVPMLEFPLQQDALGYLADRFASHGVPNGRDVLVLEHGLWNQLDVERTMAWVEQIETALEMRTPALFDPDLDPRLFPRLMLSPTTQGANVPGKYLCLQNNIRLQAHVHRIGPWSQDRGYDYLGLYNLTAQTTSVDGVHAGFKVNMVKAMMVLNWLNTLKPSAASMSRPTIPAAPLDAFKTDTPHATLQRKLAAEARLTRSRSSETESATISSTGSATTTTVTRTMPTAPHPIDTLISQAQIDHDILVDGESRSVKSAAEKYRKRRGRHPPPGFDKWVNYAHQQNSLIVEDFFDSIYDSIDMLWGVPAGEMRDFSSRWHHMISIRKGRTTLRSSITVMNDPMAVWQRSLDRLPTDALPDVDLAFNPYDEPIMFIPWDLRQDSLARANASKGIDLRRGRKSSKLFPSYPPLSAPLDGPALEEFDDDMVLWELASKACPPESPAAKHTYNFDFSTPTNYTPGADVDFLKSGYVTDWAASKSPCQDPTIADNHGSFVGPMRWRAFRTDALPETWSLITKPYPMLAPCRIHDVTYEIPIPCSVCFDAAGEDAKTDSSSETAAIPWEEKKARFFWRGVASGGINDADNWTRFQRHRFVSMLNATSVSLHLRAHEEIDTIPAHLPGGAPELPHNFAMPPDTESADHTARSSPPHPIQAMQGPAFYIDLPGWINRHTNVSFTHLRCWPINSWFTNTTRPCPYSGPYYSVAPKVNASTNFEYKYLPDIDGAAFSGRFWGFLNSGSMPLKSTIYDEWSDGRLTPWWDFVPLTVGLSDLWGVMQWAVGFDPEDYTIAALGIEAWGWASNYLGNRKGPVQARRQDVVGVGSDKLNGTLFSNSTMQANATAPKGIAGHDEAAGAIARQGQEWAKRVLRREDMDIYLYRVVLEVARVCADEREDLGFVDDLKEG